MSATTRFEESNIISTHGDFVVTYQGMAHLENYFFIDRDDLWNVEYEDFSHMYEWLDETDFNACLSAAQDYHVSRDYAEEQASYREELSRKERLFSAYAFIDAYNNEGTLLLTIEDEEDARVEGVIVTIADDETGITYSEEYTSDSHGFIIANGLPMLRDGDGGDGDALDTDYIVTFDDVGEDYDTPDPLTVTLAPSTLNREIVALEEDTGTGGGG